MKLCVIMNFASATALFFSLILFGHISLPVAASPNLTRGMKRMIEVMKKKICEQTDVPGAVVCSFKSSRLDLVASMSSK